MTTEPQDSGFVLIRTVLLASGLLAVGVAAASLGAPHAYFAIYGIDLNSNVGLINEMKAPAGLFLIAGLLTLCGVLRVEFVRISLATATVAFLSYGLSRLLSMMIDGVPADSLVLAAIIELIVGGTCLSFLLRMRCARAPSNTRL